MNETTDKVSAATTNVASNEEVTPTEAVEEWRPVVGYEGLYEVSNIGRVRNASGLIMSLYKNNKGYYMINLWDGKKHNHWLVSRLVAIAFIPNPDNKPNVDHINTDQSDNRVENLRWCTQSENLANPISRARLNEALHIAKSTPEGRERNRQAQLKCKGTPEARKQNEESHAFQKIPIMCEETGEIFDGIAAAERALGLANGHIQNSIRNYRLGKPRIYGKRNGKQILHFIPLDRKPV